MGSRSRSRERDHRRSRPRSRSRSPRGRQQQHGGHRREPNIKREEEAFGAAATQIKSEAATDQNEPEILHK